MDLTVVALHGFLGTPEDWRDVAEVTSFEWLCPDYTRLPELAEEPLDTWANAFAGWLKNQRLSSRRIFVGYSQGGRLGLHLLREHADLFNRFVIVSAQTGLLPEARAPRIQHDENWARRFASEDWNEVMADWNSQPVFGGKHAPLRSESPEARAAAALGLRQWSLGRQQDLVSAVRTHISKIDFVVGEDDPKYRELAEETRRRAGEGLRIHVVPSAGHRVPLEKPEKIASILNSIAAEI